MPDTESEYLINAPYFTIKRSTESERYGDLDYRKSLKLKEPQITRQQIMLNANADLVLNILVEAVGHNRTEPIEITSGGRPIDSNFYCDIRRIFFIESVQTKSRQILAYAGQLYDFFELIAGHLVKHMDDHEYPMIYEQETGRFRPGSGYRIKYVTRKKIKSLRIRTIDCSEEIFLDQIDCRAIVKKFQKIDASCRPLELYKPNYQFEKA